MSLHHPAAPTAAPTGDPVTTGGRRNSAAVAAGVLLAAVAVALVAQFALERLADQSDLWHWAQHALLFWSGLGAGVALVILYRHGQRRA